MYFFVLAGWLLRMFCRQQIIEIINPTWIYLISPVDENQDLQIKRSNSSRLVKKPWGGYIFSPVVSVQRSRADSGVEMIVEIILTRTRAIKLNACERREKTKNSAHLDSIFFFIKSSIFQVEFWTWRDTLGDPIQGPALKINKSFISFAFIRFLFHHFFLFAEVKNLLTN